MLEIVKEVDLKAKKLEAPNKYQTFYTFKSIVILFSYCVCMVIFIKSGSHCISIMSFSCQ